MDWTTGAAVWGAGTGTVALFLTYLQYKSGQAQLKPTTSLKPADSRHPAYLVVSVHNKGRAPGQLVSIDLDLPGPHTIPLPLEGNARSLQGEPLPTIIQARSTQQWKIPADMLLSIANRNGWRHQVRAVITQGGGRGRVFESIHKYTNLVSG